MILGLRLPSHESLSNPTERALWRWDTREYFSSDPKDYWTIHYMNRLEAVLRAINESVRPGGEVLDVGCAQGTTAILLAERGYKVTAIDANPHCLFYARRRHEFGFCKFVCLDVVKGRGLETIRAQFDAIVLGEVLEHVPRPRNLLMRCKERLRPGGRLVITTPNGESPHNWRFRKYNPAIMESSDRNEISSGLGGRETHLFNFGVRGLLDLVRKCGFAIDSCAYLNSYVVNPLNFHRLLPLSAAVATNRLCARLPGIARLTTMTLFIVAEHSG